MNREVDLQMVVIAAGNAERFGGPHTNKHLAIIAAEPILGRLLRLWLPWVTSVVVVVPPDRIATYSVLQDSKVEYRARVEPPGNDSLKYLEAVRAWDGTSDLLIALGDVFFTRAAIKSIADRCHGAEAQFFCRMEASGVTGSRWGEIFAVFVPANQVERLRTAILDVSAAYDDGLISRNKGWEVAKRFEGVPYTRFDEHMWLDCHVEVDDLTDDVDFQTDYENYGRLVPNSLDDAVETISRLLSFTSMVLQEHTDARTPEEAHRAIVNALATASQRQTVRTWNLRAMTFRSAQFSGKWIKIGSRRVRRTLKKAEKTRTSA